MFNTVVIDYNERMIWFICLQTTVYDTASRGESWAGRRKVAVLCTWQLPRGEANPPWWGDGVSTGNDKYGPVGGASTSHGVLVYFFLWIFRVLQKINSCCNSAAGLYVFLSKCSAIRPSQPYRSLSKHSLPIHAVSCQKSTNWPHHQEQHSDIILAGLPFLGIVKRPMLVRVALKQH